MSVQPSQDSNKWIIEVEGKRYGPYTYEEITVLLNQQQLKPTDRVNTVDLKGKWMTINELLKGVTHNDGEVDPSVSLFDALQLSKQRAAQKRLELDPHAAEEFVITSKPHPTTTLWFKIIGGLLLGLLIVEVIKLFPSKSPGDLLNNGLGTGSEPSRPTVQEVTPQNKASTPKLAPTPAQLKEDRERLEREKREKADRDKRAKDEREAKERDERDKADRDRREREDRERDEKEREESAAGREHRDGDFSGDEGHKNPPEGGAEPPGEAGTPGDPGAPGSLRRGSQPGTLKGVETPPIGPDGTGPTPD